MRNLILNAGSPCWRSVAVLTIGWISSASTVLASEAYRPLIFATEGAKKIVIFANDGSIQWE